MNRCTCADQMKEGPSLPVLPDQASGVREPGFHYQYYYGHFCYHCYDIIIIIIIITLPSFLYGLFAHTRDFDFNQSSLTKQAHKGFPCYP